jgi:3',5'-nucleoside bisphosphate phosphatase
MDTTRNEFHSIDLHIHSSYSEDGEFTPTELFKMCIDVGLSIIAIADHNCVNGAREVMKIKKTLEEANQTRLSCYPAIEIDCTFQNTNFHVLGYHIDLMSTDFDTIEQNVRNQCVAASKERLRLINGLGFHLKEADLQEITSGGYWSEHWTGEVFAEALLKSPFYLEEKLLLPYREGGARSDNPYVNFYWDYCSQGKPCYVNMTFPDMREVIDIIHRNHGKAVLAHPGINLKDNFDLIDELIPLGIDGIEAFSSYHDTNTAQWFFTKARQHNLCVTRGSDFHGKTKPKIKLGHSGGNPFEKMNKVNTDKQ